MNRILEYMVWLLIAGLAYVFFCIMEFKEANAATVWTQQAGIYNYYLAGTAQAPKYVLSTDIESIPSTYVKQAGQFIQCKSSGGSNRYWPVGYDCTGKQVVVPPPPPPDPVATACNGEFVCHPDWGWIVDLTQLKEGGCNHVKISKQEALFYEGLRYQNGEPICKKWPANQ